MPDPATAALGFLPANDLDAVLAMPWPFEVAYDSLDADVVLDGLKKLIITWIPILSRDRSFGAEQLDPGDEQWRIASLRLAGHFVEALRCAEPKLIEGEHKWSPFTRSFQDALLLGDYGLDATIERKLLSEFCQGYFSAYFTEIVGSAALWPDGTGWDLFSFWSITTTCKTALVSEHSEHLRMGHFFAMAIAERGKQAADERDKRDVERREQVWGPLINYRELGTLARRSELMIERHGEKNIEERFEQQLSVLFQSFGFIVAKTSRGQRRVDLICIATQNETPYTILVEAKTTSSPYSLPTKDSRALKEYVDTYRSKLKSFPPLKLVLITGQEPTRTLESKIRALETSVSLPVRYCDANLLASLRASFVGVLPPQTFLKSAIEDSPILSPEIVEKVTKELRDNTEAHTEFIKRLIT